MTNNENELRAVVFRKGQDIRPDSGKMEDVCDLLEMAA